MTRKRHYFKNYNLYKEITQTRSKEGQIHLHVTHCLDPLYVPLNIIKISQRVSKLWHMQDCLQSLIKVDKSNRKHGRVTILVCDTPYGLENKSYQILSKYLKGYESYEMHKV